MKEFLQNIALVVWAIGGLAVCLFQVNELLNRPIIYTSYSTKQCKFIELADGTIQNCDSIDSNSKYFHEWCE